MKPPQRRRAAPARYLGEVTGPAAWSPREKRQLLRLLQARQGQPEPDATELARELPGRSEAEVRNLGKEPGVGAGLGCGRSILAVEGRGVGGARAMLGAGRTWELGWGGRGVREDEGRGEVEAESARG